MARAQGIKNAGLLIRKRSPDPQTQSLGPDKAVTHVHASPLEPASSELTAETSTAAHPREKERGTCTWGKDCGFAHTKEKYRSPSPNPGAGKGRNTCAFFAAGTCKFGADCRDLHGGPSPGNGNRGQGKVKTNLPPPGRPRLPQLPYYGRTVPHTQDLVVSP